MRSIGRMAALAALAAAAGACMKSSEPAPAPPPRPAPPPQSMPPSPPPPPAPGWEDAALTAGEWRYDAARTEASYGVPGAQPRFVLRCDPASRAVAVSGESGGPLTIRTSSTARTLAAPARLAASDPLLDAIAFSRGRFAVDAPGAVRLVLPAWPETARVAEDCRS